MTEPTVALVPAPPVPPSVDQVIAELRSSLAVVQAQLATANAPKPNVFKVAYSKLEGLKTIIFGAVVGVVGPVTDYFGGIDLHGTLGIAPGTAVAIGAGIVGLRAVTKGPVAGMSK